MRRGVMPDVRWRAKTAPAQSDPTSSCKATREMRAPGIAQADPPAGTWRPRSVSPTCPLILPLWVARRRLLRPDRDQRPRPATGGTHPTVVAVDRRRRSQHLPPLRPRIRRRAPRWIPTFRSSRLPRSPQSPSSEHRGNLGPRPGLVQQHGRAGSFHREIRFRVVEGHKTDAHLHLRRIWLRVSALAGANAAESIRLLISGSVSHRRRAPASHARPVGTPPGTRSGGGTP